MPVVPTLDPSQRVTPTTDAATPVTSAASADLMTQGTRQIGALGDALGQAASVQSQIAADAQSRINQTRVDDAWNQVQAQAYTLKYDPQNGYANKTGVAAITPDANGLMPADVALGKLNDSASTVRGQLTPIQQQLFDSKYGAFATQFHGEALAHEGAQTRAYSLQTNNDTIKLAQDSAVQDYANPSLLDEHVISAGNAGYKNAQVQGLQGPALTATVKAAQSSAIMSGWQAAIANGDIASASAIQKRYGASLTADDAVKVDSTMKTANNNVLGTTAAMHATQGLAQSATSAGTAFGANIIVESGGKQTNPDGTPVTSSKGAVGIAQVLPDTAKETAAKHGVAWDEQKFRTDAQYNAALGQMYWNDQLAANNGDVAKADAAYNAGPGALQKAIAKATAAGTPGNWLAYMPVETQAYVPKVAAARSNGATYQPTKEDIYARLQADPSLAGNPAALKIAQEAADKQFEAHTEAVKQRRTESLAQAQATLIQNGGDMSQLSPALVASVDPKEIPALQEYAGKIRQGGTTTNPALYQDITQNPQKYAGMTDAQWFAVARPNLSEGDFKTLTQQRAERINGTSSNSPGSLNMAAVTSTLNQRLESMGINPNPSMTGVFKDLKTAQRVGAIRQFVTSSILDAQQQAGRKFSESEISDHIDSLFAKTVKFRYELFGWGPFSYHEDEPSTVNMLSMATKNDIPDTVLPLLKADFAARGVPKPTDGQLLGAYWMMNNTRAKK